MATQKKTVATSKKQPVVVQIPDDGRVQPQARDLEETVLGAILLEKNAYFLVHETLKPDSFYEKRHEQIYKAVCDLASSQQPIDLKTVAYQLQKNGVLEEAGGPAYLAELSNKVVNSSHLEHHAKIVAEKSLARQLISYTGLIQGKAFDESNDVSELMNEAEASLFELAQRNIKNEAMQINPLIRQAMDLVNKAAAQTGTRGIPSGFTEVDKITAGWQKSDLIIIAARPAMGKTAFVLSMAKNMAVDFKRPVAIFSLEMSNVQLVTRLIVNVSEIEAEKIKSGQLQPYEWEQLDFKVKDLFDAPIYVDDTPGLSVFELRSKARRLVREHKVECIFIDYLQLMNASGMMSYGSNRENEVRVISQNLKNLAKELDIPVIALSQLNRNIETRINQANQKSGQAAQKAEGKKPQLSDLRESGAIEQDADIVCFIHRPEYYKIYADEKGNSTQGIAEFIIAKHRNGRTDEVRLRFQSELARFKNLDGAPVKVVQSSMNKKKKEEPKPPEIIKNPNDDDPLD
ncbi:MAG: replicative DNA helicase [Tannerella sp.]|jgi:replicative DNA helicase|nr:replicative DNA helicase [Tannerella sp.]